MNESNKNSEIENWKAEIQSENWEIALNAAKNLEKVGGDNIVQFLISLLESENVGLRNTAALSLRRIKNNRAIEPLLKSIFNPKNRDYNGTMVYALQTLDCKNNLVELFKILFYESYESKIGAYHILEEQIFEFSRNDLFEIQKMWEDWNDTTKSITDSEDEEERLIIQDTYDGFMEYLK